MSQPDKVVRQPITVRGRSRRGLEERVCLRFPSLVALALRANWRLPPRSWPRRALLARASQISFDATNRGDFEVSFMFYRADCELITPPSLVGIGFEPVYSGREARVEFQRRWTAEWGQMRFMPDELCDLGDRVLFTGRIEGSGASSGAAFGSEWANIITISGGRVAREQPFFDVREALSAAGLEAQ